MPTAQPTMRCNVWMVAGLVLATLLASGFITTDAKAAPSREACTCNIKGSGANVSNAAICTLSISGPKRWCRFFINSLQGQTKTAKTRTMMIEWARDAKSSAFPNFIEEELKAFSAFLERNVKKSDTGSQGIPIEHIKQIAYTIDKYSDAVRTCIVSYQEAQPKFIELSGGHCEVTKATKSMVIVMWVRETEYVISFRPPD